MTEQVPEAARQLAGRLAEAFERDRGLAEQLADAQHRLQAANDRLWSGLHPEGLAAVYGDHPQFEAVQLEATLDNRSEVLESSDPLGELQKAHWAIHRAFSDYQQISEDRRHLAAEIGELIAGLVAELVAVGWSEDQARNADVRQLAGAARAR